MSYFLDVSTVSGFSIANGFRYPYLHICKDRWAALQTPSMKKKVLQTHAIPRVDLQHGAQKVACYSNICTGHGLEFEIKVLLKRSAVRQVA